MAATRATAADICLAIKASPSGTGHTGCTRLICRWRLSSVWHDMTARDKNVYVINKTTLNALDCLRTIGTAWALDHMWLAPLRHTAAYWLYRSERGFSLQKMLTREIKQICVEFRLSTQAENGDPGRLWRRCWRELYCHSLVAINRVLIDNWIYIILTTRKCK
jgi:hypothetical protein